MTRTGWWAGVEAAILAIIALAVWRLGRAAVKTPAHLAIGIAAAAAALWLDEIAALLGCGLLGMAWLAGQTRRGRPAASRVSMLIALAAASGLLGASLAAQAGVDAAPVRFSLWAMGLFFLKTGSVLYGSGYVLIAFLEGGLVRELGWLTHQQLLDAVAVGQFTPGPVLTTATFIGYLLAGTPGAIVATLAIFLPSFLFVAAIHRVIPKLRRNIWSASFIDAVNVSAIGLMAVVASRLSWTAMTGWRQAGIATGALLLGVIWDVRPPVLLAFGAAAGFLFF